MMGKQTIAEMVPFSNPCLSVSRRFVGKRKPGRARQKSEAHQVVPTECFSGNEPGKNHKNNEGDDFLEYLESMSVEHLVPDAVRRNLKAILKKGNALRDANHHPKRPVMEVFEMTVPSEGHQGVGSSQKQNGLKQGRQ